jgi:hypothetical protein
MVATLPGRPVVARRSSANVAKSAIFVPGDHLSRAADRPFQPRGGGTARDELVGFDLSKGTVRFTSGKPIPDDALKRLLGQVTTCYKDGLGPRTAATSDARRFK